MKPTPTIFDMDIGKDPDDTAVAVMVGLNPQKYNPQLIITNDESETKGRARFLAEVIRRTGANIPIAAGLPSTRKRKNTLVERAGLVPEGADFISDGIAKLAEVIEANQKIVYFGLGALTNLATVLHQHPEFTDRIQLVQMGGAFPGLYHKDAPEYNVRIDVESFRSVIAKVRTPRLLMSHCSWGAYTDGSRQQIGIYVMDPLWIELTKRPESAQNLFAKHLFAWDADRKDCSIMHDPLTVLSFYEDIVDFTEGEIIIDRDGFAHLTERSKAELRQLAPDRLVTLGDYLQTPTPNTTGVVARVEFSLRTDYAGARNSIARELLGSPQIADEWKAFNSSFKPK